MSKQYLTTHTVEEAHPSDIFSVASTSKFLFSGSGASAIKIHSTTHPEYPLFQTIEKAHELGTHHLAAAANGQVVASAGFGGEVKIWRFDSEHETWEAGGVVKESKKAIGELWAVALTAEGTHLAASAHDGKVRVWDITGNDDGSWPIIAEYETKGSFGMSLAISQDGRYTASGHENGSVYVFNNDTRRLLHSLPVQGLIKPVRAVTFSPGTSILAAAGDGMTISLYDVSSGEQVSSLVGHNSWVMSLDFSFTGEWLLSGSFDGKVKVWGMETRSCVATHGETDQPVWAVEWLPKVGGRGEQFVIAGENKSISFYREASGA